MKTEVILFVRDNIDWRNMTVDKLKEQKLRASPRQLERIAEWNETKNISYFEYRRQLTNIAAQSWAQVEQVSAIIKADYKLLRRLLKGAANPSKDYRVLITDDDDWFAPHVADMLLSRSDFEILSWPEIRYSTIRKRCEKGRRSFGSTNYAVSSSGYTSVTQEDRHHLIRTHARAATQTPTELVTIEEVMLDCSIKVDNESSVTEYALKPERIEQHTPLWANDYIQQLEALNQLAG